MRNVPDSAIQFLSRTSNKFGGFSIFSTLGKATASPFACICESHDRVGAASLQLAIRKDPRVVPRQTDQDGTTLFGLHQLLPELDQILSRQNQGGPKANSEVGEGKPSGYWHMENGPCTDDLWRSIVMKIMIFHSYVMTGGRLVCCVQKLCTPKHNQSPPTLSIHVGFCIYCGE